MQLTSFNIQPQLRTVVRSAWVLESNDNNSMPPVLRTTADGCPGLIFQPATAGTLYQNGKELSQTFVFGQSTRHAELSTNGSFRSVGVTFYPNALRTLFNYDAHELTDCCTDTELIAQHGAGLTEKLKNATSANQQHELISNFLIEQLEGNNHVNDREMQYCMEQIINTGGNVSLKELQQQLRLSERSFQRNFKRYTGMPPKLFARICKFRASLQQLQQNGRTNKLTAVAYDNAYADQSHFIRSFKEFAGVSPLHYLRRDQPTADDLLQLI